MQKDATYWAKTFANTLANEVSTCISLSDLTYSEIEKMAELSSSEVRAIRNLDVQLPIGVWMRFVLGARPAAVNKYIEDTNSAFSTVPNLGDCHSMSKPWLTALAKRIQSSHDPIRHGSTLRVLCALGDHGAFVDWCELAMATEEAHGLDASHLDIVPARIKKHLDGIWDESITNNEK